MEEVNKLRDKDYFVLFKKEEIGENDRIVLNIQKKKERAEMLN